MKTKLTALLLLTVLILVGCSSATDADTTASDGKLNTVTESTYTTAEDKESLSPSESYSDESAPVSTAAAAADEVIAAVTATAETTDGVTASETQDITPSESTQEQAPPVTELETILSEKEKEEPGQASETSAPQTTAKPKPIITTKAENETTVPKVEAPKPVTTDAVTTDAVTTDADIPLVTMPGINPPPLTGEPVETKRVFEYTPPFDVDPEEIFTQADHDRIIAEVSEYASNCKDERFVFVWDDSLEFSFRIGWLGNHYLRYDGGVDGVIDCLKYDVDCICEWLSSDYDEGFATGITTVEYKILPVYFEDFIFGKSLCYVLVFT